MNKINQSIVAIIVVVTLLCARDEAFALGNTAVKPKVKSKTMSKLKDAATRGYGMHLGREAARETINGVKKAWNLETATKMKEAVKGAVKK